MRGRLRIAAAEIGDQMQALAIPRSALGNSRRHHWSASALSHSEYQSKPPERRIKPVKAMVRGLILSVSAPVIGAKTISRSAIGTSISADWIGEKPRTI